MKKHVRLLSLVLSMVLLFISAVPAFAVDGIPTCSQGNETNQASGYESCPLYVHSVTTTPIAHSSLDLKPTYYSVYHSGHYDNVVEFHANEGDVTWSVEGSFHEDYEDNLWDLASYNGIARSVDNAEDEFYLEIGTDYPKGEYTVFYGCHHSFVSYFVFGDGEYKVNDTVSRAPYVDQTYLCVDY